MKALHRHKTTLNFVIGSLVKIQLRFQPGQPAVATNITAMTSLYQKIAVACIFDVREINAKKTFVSIMSISCQKNFILFSETVHLAKFKSSGKTFHRKTFPIVE